MEEVGKALSSSLCLAPRNELSLPSEPFRGSREVLPGREDKREAVGGEVGAGQLPPRVVPGEPGAGMACGGS